MDVAQCCVFRFPVTVARAKKLAPASVPTYIILKSRKCWAQFHLCSLSRRVLFAESYKACLLYIQPRELHHEDEDLRPCPPQRQNILLANMVATHKTKKATLPKALMLVVDLMSLLAAVGTFSVSLCPHLHGGTPKDNHHSKLRDMKDSATRSRSSRHPLYIDRKRALFPTKPR